MDKVKTFTVRYDERTKQILVSLLIQAEAQIAEQIASGDYTDTVLASYEELAMVKRGILLTQPDDEEEETPTEQPGDPALYKSQEHRGE